MSSDPNIKTVRLTAGVVGSGGGGAGEMGGEKTRRKGRKGAQSKTFKVDRHGREEEGGGSTSPGTLVQLMASSNPGDPKLPAAVGVDSALTAKGAPLEGGKLKAEMEGGKPKVETPVKVVLGAAKKKGHVILAAAKPAAGAASAAKTRKVSRAKKVRMTISCLGKKIHKAKEIRKAATDSTVDEVKKVLTKAGLIKADSKAPETMLRQMYADYMTLKGRAL